jgi:hypothetical protein
MPQVASTGDPDLLPEWVEGVEAQMSASKWVLVAAVPAQVAQAAVSRLEFLAWKLPA